MYAFYRQIHSPTGIEGCSYCHFFSKEEKNLVVAKATELTVYRLIKNAETPLIKRTDKTPAEGAVKEKLEQIATYQLHSRIMSMKSAPLTSTGRDALLLAFSDAKLSIIEYDPSTHDLRTMSMHFFEEEEMKDGYYDNPYPPIIEVDPDNRCAVMLIYGSKLVVLPFRRDTKADDSTPKAAGPKSAVLPSYMINLTDVDSHLMNILDFKFLHGYYEPTLVILHEPVRTWPGRVAVRHDTCALVALSLSISQRVHPIIWSQGSLPYDCSKMLSVPKPIGGVLVFATNSLLYLNQSIPPYGVSLNSITDWSTTFPLKQQENVTLTLDCCQATFITSDRMVISLNDGQIYVLTLLVDGMRAMKGFHLDKAASSVLTSCVCLIEKTYLFLGSRLGNSLLLKFSEKYKLASAASSKTKEPPVKKMRGGASDWIVPKPNPAEDIYELEVYGKEVPKPGTQVTSYSFEVCDSLLNIGPCATMEMGEPALLSEEFQGGADQDLELVVCSGYAKNGALSILQRTVRPQVVTTFQLPGCLDMWTVFGTKPKGASKVDSSGDDHAFLILSKEDTSMILQTGQEIAEVDESGFSTQAPTIFAGNLGEDNYIVQVSPMGVRLLNGVTQVQHIPIDMGSPIISCSIADPHIVVLSENGGIIMLTLKADQHGKNHKLTIHKPPLTQHSKVTAISAYRDVSGIFTTTSKDSSGLGMGDELKDLGASHISGFSTAEEPTTVDDEDELLYGTSEPEILKMDTAVDSPSVSDKPADETVIEPTQWCAVCRDNGKLEIYRLPDFQVVFMVRNFSMAQKVLVDTVQSMQNIDLPQSQQQQQSNKLLPQVKEILMVGLGNKRSRPYIMAIFDEDLVIYEGFSFHGATQENHLKLRFKKVPHCILMREKKKRAKKAGAGDSLADEMKTSRKVARLRPFYDVSTYSGVFICGPYPHWITVTTRGALRVHAMFVDGPITSFTSFHNINCPRGFLYFNFKGELRVSVLPSHLSYDADWPVRKVGMRCTTHFVVYHPDSKTYCVVTSNLDTCKHVVKFENDERKLEDVERDDRFINSTKEKFALQLYSPLNWDPIPNTRIEYDLSEHVTCLKIVSLQTEDSIDKKNFIAVGTSQVYSEDYSAKGRVYIYSVIEVVPEPGQPLTKNKLKVMFEQDQKGALSALCDVKGQLLTCIGQKVYLWTVKDNDLVGLAFIDTQIYINNAVSLKQFVLITDISKSVFLLQYQEEHRTLALVSKDSKPLEVYSCAFLVHDTQLGFLVSDADCNLVILRYHPEARESYGGTRLLRRGDINISCHVNTFQRLKCKNVDPASGLAIGGPTRHIAYFATLDGGLGMLLPMSEKIYRRLLMLQNTLVTSIQHLGGINPKGSRHIVQGKKTLTNPHRNIIDGDLIWKYVSLSTTEKNEIARRIGTNSEQIMDDLMDIERSTYHF